MAILRSPSLAYYMQLVRDVLESVLEFSALVCGIVGQLELFGTTVVAKAVVGNIDHSVFVDETTAGEIKG